MPQPLAPPPYSTTPRSLERDTVVERFTAGGPGGQHRNKTQNAVRLHHAKSGLIVSATERRSLEANRRAAFERLVAGLERLNEVRAPRRPTRPGRGAIERRLAEKGHAAKRKSNRRPPSDD